MAYTNSSLVSYTKLSPNHSGQRTHSIDRITPHCVVGQCSVETLGNIFLPTSRQASSNYGIGVDGRVGMYVEEKNRSWCSSSAANDQRAVTIECASDNTEPYAFKDVVYQRLIELCTDICKRNGKTKLLWLGDKAKTLNYTPKSDEMVLTVHRWFANKSCPGNWMYARMGDLASKVTAALGSEVKPIEPTQPTGTIKAGDLVTITGSTYYRNNHIEKKLLPNRGELPMYYAEGTHEPIIDQATFDKAQERLRILAQQTSNRKKPTHSAFSGLIHCGLCGNTYKRVTYRKKHYWNCTTFQTKGKSECAAKRIPEETLEVLTCEVLGEGSIDSDMVRSKITAIRAEKNNVVVYCMDDGSEIVKRWKDRSRAESWTPEMKEKARQRALQARRKKE